MSSDDCRALWPYEGFRPGQYEIAAEVARTVREGALLSVNAPTGFGKTPSVILGLLCGGAERVLYLVRTVNEVDPVLRELKRFGAEYTFLYSARRMCPLFRGSSQSMTSEEFWAACRLARLQGACPYYERLEEVDEGLLVRAVREGGERGSRRIVEYLAGSLGVCPFFALRSLVDSSRFIVATYPYAFRADIFQSTFDPHDYGDFVIVVDEAHSLMNAHSLYERRLRRQDVERAIEEARKYVPSGELVIRVLQELLARIRLLERTVRGKERLEKAMAGPILEELDIVEGAAEEVLRRKIEEAILSGSQGREARSALARVAAWAAVLSLPSSYLFAERVNGDLELVATPMDPAVPVKPVLEKARAAVLLSGTLPRGDYVRELLGVERPARYVDAELMYGVRGAAGRVYTVVARNVTTRYRERTPEMYRTIAVYVSLIARLMPGAKLAVYPSYDVMGQVVDKMPAGIPMIVETRKTNIAEVQERLVEEPGLLINAVADGKLVEGVEFVVDGRNLLRTVIVVGVPFPQPDVYTLTLKEVLGERIGSRRADYYVYLFSAVVKVRQALGRATRSPEDRAAYFLLDYRFLRRDIKEHLRLPVNRVVASLEGLRQAISEARRFVEGKEATPPPRGSSR